MDTERKVKPTIKLNRGFILKGKKGEHCLGQDKLVNDIKLIYNRIYF